MNRFKRWLVCGILLLDPFLVACVGPMAQDDSLLGATSTMFPASMSEPIALANIPNTPEVTLYPSPVVNMEPTPEPSPTSGPTEVPPTLEAKPSSEPTETPSPATATSEPPTATSEPTDVPGIFIPEFGFRPQIMETIPESPIESILRNGEFENTWPLYRLADGNYKIRGITTNHRYSNMALGQDGRFKVYVVSEFHFIDSNGDVRHLLVPQYMVDDQTGYAYRVVNTQNADNYPLNSRELTEGLVDRFRLGSKGRVIDATLYIGGGNYGGNDYRDYGNGYITQTASSFLAPLFTEYAVTSGDIALFSRTGDPSEFIPVGEEVLIVPTLMEHGGYLGDS